MPRIVGKAYRFKASLSPDVTGYNVYIGKRVNDVDVDFAYENEAQKNDVDQGDSGDLTTVTVNLAPLVSNAEGDYDVAVTAYDAAGNESDFGAIVRGVALDFTPPLAPTEGVVESY